MLSFWTKGARGQVLLSNASNQDEQECSLLCDCMSDKLEYSQRWPYAYSTYVSAHEGRSVAEWSDGKQVRK